MAFDITAPQGDESGKIWHRVIPYARGRVLDIGCGPWKCLPHMIGVDSRQEWKALEWRPDVVGAADDLSMFADGIIDGIYSSHLLEHFPPDAVPGLLRLWRRKLRDGGHLILYLPSANLYPKCDTEIANPDHKWDIYPGDIEGILAAEGGWTMLECEERGQNDEYSLFQVYRKTEGTFINATPEPAHLAGRRAAVVRMGAIGDTAIAASVVPGLRERGYAVSMVVRPEGAELLRHDRNIDDLIVIDPDDMLPPGGLGTYIERLGETFDLVVDMDHSVEGTLLGHRDFTSYRWPIEARRLVMGGHNYQELAEAIAGVGRMRPMRFRPSREEAAWAAKGRASLKEPAVLWCISGSSLHKVYPWVNIVAGWLAERRVNVVLAGGQGASTSLQDAILQTMLEHKADTSFVYPRVGQWSLRQTLSFAQTCDVVVGPETGVLNALAGDDVAKVVYLSHSSHENLTKHWRRTLVLEPDRERAPCFPCHRIHHSWATCVKNEATGGAQCASSVAPELVLDAIERALRGAVPPIAEILGPDGALSDGSVVDFSIAGGADATVAVG